MGGLVILPFSFSPGHQQGVPCPQVLHCDASLQCLGGSQFSSVTVGDETGTVGRPSRIAAVGPCWRTSFHHFPSFFIIVHHFPRVSIKNSTTKSHRFHRFPMSFPCISSAFPSSPSRSFEQKHHFPSSLRSFFACQRNRLRAVKILGDFSKKKTIWKMVNVDTIFYVNLRISLSLSVYIYI